MPVGDIPPELIPGIKLMADLDPGVRGAIGAAFSAMVTACCAGGEAAALADAFEPASAPAPVLPDLDAAMRAALRRLRRGDCSPLQLSQTAGVSKRTIGLWVCEVGPLYAHGVRRIRHGTYSWPRPTDACNEPK